MVDSSAMYRRKFFRAFFTGRQLTSLRDDGWLLPPPEGEWSYVSHDSKIRSRLDHALASPNVGRIACRYVIESEGIVAAGPGGVSDHAILIVDCETD